MKKLFIDTYTHFSILEVVLKYMFVNSYTYVCIRISFSFEEMTTI